MRPVIRKFIEGTFKFVPTEREECNIEGCGHQTCHWDHSEEKYFRNVPIELSDDEAMIVLQVNTNRLLSKILGCMVFFVVLTIISLILSLVSAIPLIRLLS